MDGWMIDRVILEMVQCLLILEIAWGNRKVLKLAWTILQSLEPFKGERNTHFLYALELRRKFLVVQRHTRHDFSQVTHSSQL